jgi:chaperonin GroEL
MPSLLLAPHSTAALKRGFDQLADLLAATLGPTQGIVISSAIADGRPEILTDAATIARRVLQLPKRADDVGAMLLRQLVWRMNVKAGDGGATAAVLAQAILHEAQRYVAAGGNAMLLRRGLSKATQAALDALAAQAQPAQDAHTLTQVALAVTGEAELSRLLGELFARLGAEAYVSIEAYMARYLACDYHEGGRWQARLASPYFITEAATRRALQPDCYVVLCAGELNTVEDVERILSLVAQTETKRVAIIAHEIRGDALNTLVVNHQQKAVQLIAATSRSVPTKRADDFTDLSALTDATILAPERGRSWRAIQPSDFGAAQRIEANADELIVVGYAQHAERARAQAELIRRQLSGQGGRSTTTPTREDDEARKELRWRLARMEGNVATLKIGAATEAERAALKQQAEKALRALPIAVREGVVAGGGVAYVNCVDALATLRRNLATPDEAHGAKILARALTVPFQRIARNAGVTTTGAVLDEARRCGATFGYDARTRQIVDMRAAGIMDAAGVLRLALETAVSGALMALTTETIVLHQKPELSYEP